MYVAGEAIEQEPLQTACMRDSNIYCLLGGLFHDINPVVAVAVQNEPNGTVWPGVSFPIDC